MVRMVPSQALLTSLRLDLEASPVHADPRIGPSLTVAPGQGLGPPRLLAMVATKIVAAAVAVLVAAVRVAAADVADVALL